MDVFQVSAQNLSPATNFDNFSNLSQATLDHIVKLQGEADYIASSIKSVGPRVDGPARNADLTVKDLVHTFEKSSEMSVRMHENMTQFTVLSSSLTSFGNNLNSFLKGQ